MDDGGGNSGDDQKEEIDGQVTCLEFWFLAVTAGVSGGIGYQGKMRMAPTR